MRGPFRPRIAKSDLSRWGFSDGCVRCRQLRAGRAEDVSKHSEQCRKRIDTEMRRENGPRVQRAEDKHTHFQEYIMKAQEALDKRAAKARLRRGGADADGKDAANRAEAAEEDDEKRKMIHTNLVLAGPEPAAPEPERPVGEPNALRTGDRARGSGCDNIQNMVTTTAPWRDHPSTLSPDIGSQIMSKTKSELHMNIEGAPEAPQRQPH